LILTTAVFDLDVYIVENYAPFLRPILDYKLFVIIGLIVIFWIIIGKKNFPGFFVYIICYPLILMLWKIPRLMIRNWEAVIILAPALFGLFSAFRIYFMCYALAFIAIACILSTNPIETYASQSINLLILSMGLLLILFLVHLWDSLQKAYNSSVFLKISQAITAFKEKLEDTAFITNLLLNNIKENEKSVGTSQNSGPLTVYMFNFGVEFLNNKIRNVIKSQKMDLYLILSWALTFSLNFFVFSFEYLALYKINPKSFSMPFEPNYLSFLGFSFGKVTPGSASQIVPIDSYSNFLCYTEIACSVVIYFILVFTVFTVTRQRYSADIETVINELNEIGFILEQASQQVLNIKLSDVEGVIFDSNYKLINWTRRLRGMPELPPPIEGSLGQSNDSEKKE
jgi:hypothetical protein